MIENQTWGDGPEKWVPEAIAEQEEYIKRMSSCGGVLGRAHAFRTHSGGHAPYQACVVCGVTKTREDYALRITGRGPEYRAGQQ